MGSCQFFRLFLSIAAGWTADAHHRRFAGYCQNVIES
ncbi:hypothetical protein L902_16385 [Agrobacterium radiobacter DSM 30147]|nr:hypothetical protein L902_16385 [Agrobacterium radiobacter DSM 30147]